MVVWTQQAIRHNQAQAIHVRGNPPKARHAARQELQMDATAQSRSVALKHKIQLIKVFTVLLFALSSLTGGAARASDDLTLQPSPALTPQQVVDFQLTALKMATKDGMSATFRFASPANRKMTGPLARFSRLFDSPQYKPMLNNRGTEIKLISNDGFTAELLAGVVDPDGELYWYRFRLSRQTEAPHENCWMTDGVMAVPHSGDSA